jgi:hypothetical protein
MIVRGCGISRDGTRRFTLGLPPACSRVGQALPPTVSLTLRELFHAGKLVFFGPLRQQKA